MPVTACGWTSGGGAGAVQAIQKFKTDMNKLALVWCQEPAHFIVQTVLTPEILPVQQAGKTC